MPSTGETETDLSDATQGDSTPVADAPAQEGEIARNPLFVLPLLLGVLLLAVDIWIITRFSTTIFAKGVPNAIALAFIAASIVICLFLIAYALIVPRAERTDRTSSYVRLVVVPLILALVAIAAMIWALQGYFSSTQLPPTRKACIELYEQAQNIARDNPKFRMAEKDADEVRCAINKALGR